MISDLVAANHAFVARSIGGGRAAPSIQQSQETMAAGQLNVSTTAQQESSILVETMTKMNADLHKTTLSTPKDKEAVYKEVANMIRTKWTCTPRLT